MRKLIVIASNETNYDFPQLNAFEIAHYFAAIDVNLCHCRRRRRRRRRLSLFINQSWLWLTYKMTDDVKILRKRRLI